MRFFRRCSNPSHALAAYGYGLRCGDGDAYLGLTADWSRWAASNATADPHAIDREQGYADGYSQESARQQGASS